MMAAPAPADDSNSLTPPWYLSGGEQQQQEDARRITSSMGDHDDRNPNPNNRIDTGSYQQHHHHQQHHQQQYNDSDDSLVFGMSGMNLLNEAEAAAAEEKRSQYHHTQQQGHERKSTESTAGTTMSTAGTTMSSSPPGMGGGEAYGSGSGGGSAPPRSSSSSSAPTSPIVVTRSQTTTSVSSLQYSKQQQQQQPSPITKPGIVSQNNSSATSQSLTLTPTSSVDGGHHGVTVVHHATTSSHSHQQQQQQTTNYNLGSFQGGGSGGNDNNNAPSVPFLMSSHSEGHHHRAESGGGSSLGGFSLGSVGSHPDANDGLLGLEALQAERAHSASPRVIRQTMLQQRNSNAAAGGDRPPLSYSSYNTADFGSTGSGGGGGLSGSTGPTANNTSMESTDSSSRYSFGAIGQLRTGATEFDPSRRRASSSDALVQGAFSPSSSSHHSPTGAVAATAYHQPELTHKFGALPTLSSHIHQQQQQQRQGQPQGQYAEIPKPRHIRSISQPGTQASAAATAAAYNEDTSTHSYKSVGASPSRGSSASTLPAAGGYDRFIATTGGGGGRSSASNSSMSNLGYGSYSSGGGSFQMMDPRDALDFQGSSTSYMVGPPPPTSTFSSGSLSPHQMHYGGGGNGRHVASQSMPSGMAGMQHQQQQPGGRHHEDDLSLLGEHIEVPDQHEESLQPNFLQQGVSSGSHHPLLRPIAHSHSQSMDAIPAVYDHRPTAGASLPMPKVVYSVKFKRSQRNFVLGPRISRDLKIGTYVKVEADRGEDLGIVVGKLPADKYNSYSGRASFTAGMGPAMGSVSDLKRVIRLATRDEVSLLGMKREEEEELLRICRGKVIQRGLPMHVVDAEYQFDRHKLTFFFEAEGRVDFRELVRDLFSMYKTRIWMQQLDKNTSTSAQAIVAPQVAADMQMDFGTPIIAPPSEFADSIVFNAMPSDGRS